MNLSHHDFVPWIICNMALLASTFIVSSGFTTACFILVLTGKLALLLRGPRGSAILVPSKFDLNSSFQLSVSAYQFSVPYTSLVYLIPSEYLQIKHVLNPSKWDLTAKCDLIPNLCLHNKHFLVKSVSLYQVSGPLCL